MAADKQPETYTRRYRVLKAFKDLAGNDHQIDDEVDLSPDEAKGPINAGQITAALKSGQ